MRVWKELSPTFPCGLCCQQCFADIVTFCMCPKPSLQPTHKVKLNVVSGVGWVRMGMPNWLKGHMVGFSELEWEGVLGCLPYKAEGKHCTCVRREARRRGLELTEGHTGERVCCMFLSHLSWQLSPLFKTSSLYIYDPAIWECKSHYTQLSHLQPHMYRQCTI